MKFAPAVASAAVLSLSAACSLIVDFDPEGQPCDAQSRCLDGYKCVGGECVEGTAPITGSDGGTDAGVLQFEIVLNGLQLVPPQSSNFSGTGTLTFDKVNRKISWDVTHDHTRVSVGHLHFGHPAEVGPVMFTLPSVTSPMRDTITLDAAVDLADIELSLRRGFVYLDLHDTIGADALRGAALTKGQRVLTADLFDHITANFDGKAGFVLDPSAQELHYGVSLAPFDQGDTVRSAFVRAVDDDRPLVELFLNPGDPWVTYGSAEGVLEETRTLILGGGTKVKVHSNTFPNGRVEGTINVRR